MSERTDEHGALCPECKHRVTWHHDWRGCQYLGNGRDRCPCVLTSDAVVERIVAERVAQAQALIANDLREHASLAWGEHASWLTTGAKVAELAAGWVEDTDLPGDPA